MANKETLGEAIDEVYKAAYAVRTYKPIELRDTLTLGEREKITGDARYQSLLREMYEPKLAELYKACLSYCTRYEIREMEREKNGE